MDEYTRQYLRYHEPNRVVGHTGIASFNVFENMHRNKILREMLPESKKGLYLDLGCGRAPNTVALALDGRTVVGLDLDPKEIKPARAWIKERKLGKKAKIVRGDMNSMPFPDRHFDVVICIEALEHTKDMRKAGKELARVLKDSGIAIVSLPNSTSIMWKVIHAFRHAGLYSCPGIEYGREYHHELSLREIYRLMPSIGLRVDGMRSLNILPVPLVYNFLPGIFAPLVLRFSYWFRRFDSWLGKQAFFKIFGSSVILKCTKAKRGSAPQSSSRL